MIPLVDTHCHLCAGLDDGPRSLDEAVEMCRMARGDGVHWIAATAHQNEQWAHVTPRAITSSTHQLAERLRETDVPMTLRPTAEVMISPDTVEKWTQGKLLTVGGQGRYLLIEFPHDLYLDVRELVSELRQASIRPILAHPERHPELLFGGPEIDELVRLGCLVQVSSSSITCDGLRDQRRAIKKWIRRGIVQLIGSDGHSTGRRPPLMAEAYRCITSWAGRKTADRICSTNGLTVLQGLDLKAPAPMPEQRRWFAFSS